MSVLIRGMEMPTSCIKCKLCVSYKCVLTGEIRWSDEFDYDSKRFENCPLVHVPPHGRLIDADVLAEHKFVSIPHVSIDGKDAGTAYRLGWNTAIEAIMENAETIIGGE